ncbi:MAG: hypothetical protein IJI25_07420 [Eubacterium sp.]|nr:hypothetical protein [Eubacterium sp.]
MKRTLKKFATIVFVSLLIFGFAAVTGNAAANRVVKLKNQSFTSKKSVARKKAVTVKRGGWTVKMGTLGTGFLKFKAPKTKKYVFNYSGLQSNSSYTNGYTYVMVDSKYGNNYLTMSNVRTQGGVTASIYINNRSNTTGTMKYRFLSSRYAAVKLKKGQVVYLYFSFDPNASLNLKVK